MQSKVFEPLLAGKIVICNPASLAGYSFSPYEHFLPATTGKEFCDVMVEISKNTSSFMEIGSSAKERAKSLIGPLVIEGAVLDVLKAKENNSGL